MTMMKDQTKNGINVVFWKKIKISPNVVMQQTQGTMIYQYYNYLKKQRPVSITMMKNKKDYLK